MNPLSNNNRIFKPRRRKLREDSTNAERLLWQKLRGRQVGNLKFFRQFGIGPYILDFYCPSKKLAIELDGAHHAETANMEYDNERTAYLLGLGIEVIRFWNNEVAENMDAVLEKIIRSTEPNSI